MHIEDIECVKVVAECRNFSKAAELLHLSQPALSQRVQRLEAEMGCRLIVREHKNFRLTKQGEVFVRAGDRINQIYKSMVNIFDCRRNGSLSSISLAASAAYAKYCFSTIFHLCCQKLPEIELQLIEASHDERLKLLHNNETLFAIVQSSKTIGVEQRHLFSEHIIFSLPESIYKQKKEYVYEKDGREFVDISGFSNIRFLGYSTSSNMETITNRLCAVGNFIPDVIFKTNDQDLLLNLISCGMGVGFVTSMTTLKHNADLTKIRFLSIESPDAIRDYSIAWSNSILLSEKDKSFIDLIQTMHDQYGKTQLLNNPTKVLDKPSPWA